MEMVCGCMFRSCSGLFLNLTPPSPGPSTPRTYIRRTLYKVFMHVAWLLSLLWWQLLIGLFAGLISSVDSVRDKAYVASTMQ